MTTEPKTTNATYRPALVVAGMHRSGTSAMARVLSLAGGALPERVILPGPDNPLGFWEPWEMVALSDDILKAVESAWDDLFVHEAGARAWDQRDAFLARTEAFLDQNYGDRALPVIKDPRSSVLARLWRQGLENRGQKPVYVVMVRHPLEVAGSLQARDGFPIEKGLLLWAAYMLTVERDTRGSSRVFVSYPALLEDWRGVLDRIEQALGAALPDRAGAAADIDAFLSRSHRHHEADARDPAETGGPVLAAVHGWLQAAVAGAEPTSSAMDDAARLMQTQARLWRPILQDQDRRAADSLRAAESVIVDTQARLLREGARVTEMIVAEAAYRDELTASLNTAIERARMAEAGLADAASQAAELSALRLEAGELQARLDGLVEAQTAEQARLADLTRLADERAQEISRLQQGNAALKSSVSWKLTRPVRAIQSRLRRGRDRTPPAR